MKFLTYALCALFALTTVFNNSNAMLSSPCTIHSVYESLRKKGWELQQKLDQARAMRYHLRTQRIQLLGEVANLLQLQRTQLLGEVDSLRQNNFLCKMSADENLLQARDMEIQNLNEQINIESATIDILEAHLQTSPWKPSINGLATESPYAKHARLSLEKQDLYNVLRPSSITITRTNSETDLHGRGEWAQPRKFVKTVKIADILVAPKKSLVYNLTQENTRKLNSFFGTDRWQPQQFLKRTESSPEIVTGLVTTKNPRPSIKDPLIERCNAIVKLTDQHIEGYSKKYLKLMFCSGLASAGLAGTAWYLYKHKKNKKAALACAIGSGLSGLLAVYSFCNRFSLTQSEINSKIAERENDRLAGNIVGMQIAAGSHRSH